MGKRCELTSNSADASDKPTPAAARLVVAASQFPITADIAANCDWILRHLEDAKAAGADLLLTPEAALCGYGGTDFESWDDFNWPLLSSSTERLQAKGRSLGIALVLGSAHALFLPVPADTLLPMNSLYFVGKSGVIEDRYDKCQLTETDKAFYSAGRHKMLRSIGGLKVGFLICYDICYPEMYAWYRGDDVDVMLHAFYNAGFPVSGIDVANEEANSFLILDEVKPAWMRARAADNQVWIVASNSSRAHACWGNKVVRPDGSVAEELAAGEPGILLHTFPDDSRKGWEHNFRPLALRDDAEYWQGQTTDHARYRDRRAGPLS